MTYTRLFSITFCGLTLLACSNLLAKPSFEKRQDVEKFISTLSEKHHFEKSKLQELFKTITIQDRAIEKITHPYEEKPWYKYREFFLSNERINEGVMYWKKNKKTLARAEKKFGVPASIIVAIIGVESSYGKYTGDFNVLDTLSTLAFEYPPRSKFFRSELTEFLLLCREKNIYPRKLLGSYAGAIGQPQFMPSSFRKLAIDFNNDGAIDLSKDDEDIIGSIANYLAANGWKKQTSIAIPAKIKFTKMKPLPKENNPLKPSLTLQKLAEYGIYTDSSLPQNTPANVIVLQKGQNHLEYWVGLRNFYVITRYNVSINYAMATYELSEIIKEKYKKMSLKEKHTTHHLKQEPKKDAKK